jgi:hypothetical protein
MVEARSSRVGRPWGGRWLGLDHLLAKCALAHLAARSVFFARFLPWGYVLLRLHFWSQTYMLLSSSPGNRFARDDQEPGPSWGGQLPGERPRETAET